MSWKDVLYLTPSERRGVVALVGLIVLIAFAPAIYNKLKPPAKEIDYSRLDKAYAILEAKKDSVAQIEAANRNSSYKPNTSYQNNYSSKKNSYRNKNTNPQDLETEHSITETKNKKLDTEQSTPSNQPPSTQYPEPPSTKYQKSTTYKPIVVSINSATAVQFAQLRGIGPVLSERIIKYRNGLGGFYSIEQVGTVYGIEPEVFQSIKGQLVLDKAQLRKLNVNTSTQAQLSAHTFISTGLAKQIVNYREKAGNYKTEEDLLKLYFMNEEVMDKLRPYLTF